MNVNDFIFLMFYIYTFIIITFDDGGHTTFYS